MQILTRLGAVALTVVLTVWAAAPVAAQSGVTTNDIERLQYAVSDARSEISTLRSRDTALADRLQDQLNDLSDEVVYLKVRFRKERNIPRSEYTSLRDRIEQVRSQARATVSPTSSGSSSSDPGRWTPSGGTGTQTTTGGSRPTPPQPRGSAGSGGYSDESRQTTSAPRRSAPNEIPVGQELDVRLQTALNSGTSQVEDRFEATTLVDLYQDERVLVPAGSTLRGVVSAVDPATRTDRKGSLMLAFDQLTVNGRDYPIRATVVQALESEGIKGEAGRIATGAGVGAIIGGILGGFKGALAGILIGAGGTVVATEGKEVDLPVGTVLRLRFDSPVTIR